MKITIQIPWVHSTFVFFNTLSKSLTAKPDLQSSFSVLTNTPANSSSTNNPNQMDSNTDTLSPLCSGSVRYTPKLSSAKLPKSRRKSIWILSAYSNGLDRGLASLYENSSLLPNDNTLKLFTAKQRQSREGQFECRKPSLTVGIPVLANWHANSSLLPTTKSKWEYGAIAVLLPYELLGWNWNDVCICSLFSSGINTFFKSNTEDIYTMKRTRPYQLHVHRVAPQLRHFYLIPKSPALDFGHITGGLSQQNRACEEAFWPLIPSLVGLWSRRTESLPAGGVRESLKAHSFISFTMDDSASSISPLALR